MVPLVFPDPAVKVAPGGSPDAASEAIGSPFGSEAVTLTVSRLFSATVAVAGDVTVGAPLVTILIAVVAEAVKLFAAVNVTSYSPTSLFVGNHVSVPVLFPGSAANVAPDGTPDAVSEPIASPSGSTAVMFSLSVLPTTAPTVSGAVTTGARSTLFTVITVFA